MQVEDSDHMHEEEEEEDDGGFEYAGGQNEAEGGPIEESRNELDKLEKREKERKNFINQLQEQNKATEKSMDSGKVRANKMKYLLQQAELFAHFSVSKKEEKTKMKKGGSIKKHRSMHDEKEEDSSLMRMENEALEENEDEITRLTVQPSFLKSGTLKDYQLIGLNWMINLYENGINGILADEMGLGKTIQTISLLAFLKEFKKIHGPHLVLGPKSVLGNWMKEFTKWLPSAKVVKLIATKDKRDEIMQKYLQPGKFDICLTSYEGMNICKSHLKKFQWKYIIIDEAHKIKNEMSVLSKNIRELKTHYKLLLTGTPLQNNLHELWSLLNFLLPDLFESSDLFDSWFEMTSSNKNQQSEESQKDNLEMVQKLHKILKPFLLRRTKAEADKSLPPKKEVHLFVGLTETQVNLYRSMLAGRTVNDDKKFYVNLLMQLRKVCNHPYLFDGVEEEGLPELGPHLIQNSGKMIILDKLCEKLKKEKRQVLIFSQMTRILDILEDYCNYREYQYCRIDGDTEMDSRDRQIDEFTAEKSTKFIFLLSTRAGGLGINLATADTVILYDSDWNPQVDLQAMDRAHRIGQKNPVNVYRLISENTLEEKIIERQTIKLKWDTLVIQQGRFQQKNKLMTKDELKDIIQFGASEIFKTTGTFSDEDIEMILERGEKKTREQNRQIDQRLGVKDNLLDLAVGSLDLYTFDNVDYQKKRKEDELAINEAYYTKLDQELRTRGDKKRVRTYNLNELNQLARDDKVTDKKQAKIKLPEFQFFNNRERLIELLTKEYDYVQAHKTKQGQGGNKDSEKMDEEAGKQDDEEMLSGLTASEKKEKDELWDSGYPDWNKNEFHYFVQGCERLGRNNFKAISLHVKTKTPEEVEEYSKVFWKRIEELPEYQKHVRNIERGEQTLENRKQAQETINKKCATLKNPKEEIEFNPNFYNKSRSKYFNLEHDKFLVYMNYREGYGTWEKIKQAIKREPLFKFDAFFKSRTEAELSKRFASVLKVIEKENEALTTAATANKYEDIQRGRAKSRNSKGPEEEDDVVIKKKQQKSASKHSDAKSKDSAKKENKGDKLAFSDMKPKNPNDRRERKDARDEKKMKQNLLAFTKGGDEGQDGQDGQEGQEGEEKVKKKKSRASREEGREKATDNELKPPSNNMDEVISVHSTSSRKSGRSSRNSSSIKKRKAKDANLENDPEFLEDKNEDKKVKMSSPIEEDSQE